MLKVAQIKRRELRSGYSTHFENKIVPLIDIEDLKDDTILYAGVRNVSMAMVLTAYDYASSHPHRYLKGTSNWCAAVAWKLNQLLQESK